jgi:hypothetical protein
MALESRSQGCRERESCQDRQTGRQTNRQIDRQIGRHAGGQTEIPHTDRSPQADIKTQPDRQTDK